MRFMLFFVAIVGIGLCEDKTINNAPDIVKRRIVYKVLEVADDRHNVEKQSDADDTASDTDKDETPDLSERSNIEKVFEVDGLLQAPQTEHNENIQERSKDEDDSPEIENDDEIGERSELTESPEIKDDEDNQEKSMVEKSLDKENDENIFDKSNIEELSHEDETEVVDKRLEGTKTPEVEDENNSIEDNQERRGRAEKSREKKMTSSERLDALNNLKMHLKEARKDFKDEVTACGIKHNFEPFTNCRLCRSKCGAVKCPSCKDICEKDRQEFKSKGCITDRRKIRQLRKMIKKIRKIAKKLGDSKIFLPDL